MRNMLLLFIALGWGLSLKAHPSYGLVITDEGDVIFCDVLHHGGTIWKLDREGTLSKLLTGQHCHFIFQDHRGQIWGTHHDYLEARDTNENTLWRLTGGRKEVVIPPTLDPTVFSGVNFVVDQVGKIYYNAFGKLYVRETNGDIALLSPHQFGRIMSLQLAPDGQIIVVDNNADGGALIKVDPAGALTYVATALLDPDPPNPPFAEPRFNMLFAAFADPQHNIYVADSGSRRITKVDTAGRISHIYHSEAPWYPVAYAERNGVAYVMEMSYVPGKGNLGPRIQRLAGGEQTILVNIDDPAENGRRVREPEPQEAVPERSPKRGRTGRWLLGGAILLLGLILGGRLLRKKRP